jgi:hypothetical protein
MPGAGVRAGKGETQALAASRQAGANGIGQTQQGQGRPRQTGARCRYRTAGIGYRGGRYAQRHGGQEYLFSASGSS